MNVSTEILLWLMFVLPGLIFASLSLRAARVRLHAVNSRGVPPAVVEEARHTRNNQLMLLSGWLLFLGVGLFAMFDPQTHPTQEMTLTGVLALVGLIGAVAVLAVMTATDYLYTRKLWERTLSDGGS